MSLWFFSTKTTSVLFWDVIISRCFIYGCKTRPFFSWSGWSSWLTLPNVLLLGAHLRSRRGLSLGQDPRVRGRRLLGALDLPVPRIFLFEKVLFGYHPKIFLRRPSLEHDHMYVCNFWENLGEFSTRLNCFNQNCPVPCPAASFSIQNPQKVCEKSNFKELSIWNLEIKCFYVSLFHSPNSQHFQGCRRWCSSRGICGSPAGFAGWESPLQPYPCCRHL